MKTAAVDVTGGLAFLCLTAWAAQVASTPEPSQLITVGAAAHLLSILLQLGEARRSQALPEVPGWVLLLFALGLGLRLCSTTYFQGYLPIDATGDGPYQVLEGLALLCALRQLAMFEAKSAPLELGKAVGCFAVAGLCAVACFGDLDRNVVFDTLWVMSVYCETLATVAGCAHLAHNVHKRIALPYHFLLPQLLGIACRCHFWTAAYAEIKVENPVRLQQFFPEVLVGVHCVMIAANGLLLLAAAATAGTPVPEEAPPTQPLAKSDGGAADMSTVKFGELEVSVPAGCTQLVPLSAVYTADGVLRVTYKPL